MHTLHVCFLVVGNRSHEERTVLRAAGEVQADSVVHDDLCGHE